MKILTITAQKPHSTGSGFYLTEMVKGFAALGHEQAVLAGVYREDTVDFRLLEKIINFNRIDKAECSTFWRK